MRTSEQTSEGEIIIQPTETSLVLMPVMNLELAQARLREFQTFVQLYMCEGEDYGTIPGTPKPTLYKSGADKLCELYGLSDSYSIVSKTEDFERGLFDYTIECSLISRRQGQIVATGLGCCSSWESKYRWRETKRKCPSCGADAIIKGREEYGGGWVCFKKKAGCGAKFADNDPAIANQLIGRIENPDIIDQKNTILKMAKKRAKIDATLSATRSSGIFTQDMEDLSQESPSIKDAQRRADEQEKIAQQKIAAMEKEKADKETKSPFITDSQGKMLWTISKKLGLSEKDLRDAIKTGCGVEHSREIRKEDFQKLLDFIDPDQKHHHSELTLEG